LADDVTIIITVSGLLLPFDKQGWLEADAYLKHSLANENLSDLDSCA